MKRNVFVGQSRECHSHIKKKKSVSKVEKVHNHLADESGGGKVEVRQAERDG